jgi:hypothetical protein
MRLQLAPQDRWRTAMSILTASARRSPVRAARASTRRSFAARVVGAALAVGISYIHVVDQGGLPGHKSPGYIGVGYYLLEVAGVVTAALLLTSSGRSALRAWLLALGVALGPIAGYVATRGPGLPGAMDDKGVWTEQLGVISLAVEGALLLLAGGILLRARRAAR